MPDSKTLMPIKDRTPTKPTIAMKTTQSLSGNGQTASETRSMPRLRAAWTAALCSAYLLAHTCAWAQQSTTTWTNTAGGDWNTALNWDAHIIPGIATNANITGAIVTYNSPMLAPSINGISVSSDLEINAAGLNIDGSVPDGSGNSYGLAAFAVSSGAFLNVNAGGVLRATNCGFAAVNGTMNVGGTVVLDNCGTNSTPPAAAM